MDFQSLVLAKQWRLSSTQVDRLRLTAGHNHRKSSLASTSRKKIGQRQKRGRRSGLETSHAATKKLAVVVGQDGNSTTQDKGLDLLPHNTRCANADHGTGCVETFSIRSTKRAWEEFEMRLQG